MGGLKPVAQFEMAIKRAKPIGRQAVGRSANIPILARKDCFETQETCFTPPEETAIYSCVQVNKKLFWSV